MLAAQSRQTPSVPGSWATALSLSCLRRAHADFCQTIRRSNSALPLPSFASPAPPPLLAFLPSSHRPRPCTMAAMVEEIEYEGLDNDSLAINMIAGACAGIAEHAVMYPVDSIKVSSRLKEEQELA